MPGWLRSLWATNTAALIGFGAAVVAVVAAGLIAYLDKRNERSADKRAAIRLVLAEMGSDLDSLDWFVYTGRRPLAPITTTAWRTQKETLARYLTEFQWTTSAGFYERLVQSAPSLRHRRCVPD